MTLVLSFRVVVSVDNLVAHEDSQGVSDEPIVSAGAGLSGRVTVGDQVIRQVLERGRGSRSSEFLTIYSFSWTGIERCSRDRGPDHLGGKKSRLNSPTSNAARCDLVPSTLNR